MDRGVTPLKRVVSPTWGTPKGGFICNIRVELSHLPVGIFHCF